VTPSAATTATAMTAVVARFADILLRKILLPPVSMPSGLIDCSSRPGAIGHSGERFANKWKDSQ
jgi:hypothetical protein